MENNERIKVVDSPCGFGKTEWAIQYINKLPDYTRIVYITPFLKECERIKTSCSKKIFATPDAKRGRGSKMVDMIALINKGVNVVSTHALFQNIDDRLIEAIRNNNYILILDEVMDVIEKLDLYRECTNKTEEQREVLTTEDLNTLLRRGIIEVDPDTYMVKWNDIDDSLNKYVQIKNLAEREMLYLIGKDLLIWSFPIDVFKEGCFEEIFILTYQFDYQIQAYYYNFFDLKYKKYFVKEISKRKYEIFPQEDGIEIDREWKTGLKALIDICDNPKLNKIGGYYFDLTNRYVTTNLSKNWFEEASKESVDTLISNMINFFQHITKSKASERMWTCFKDNKKQLKNSYFSAKGWVELNSRATNDYADKTTLVYPINRYLNPFFLKFFSKKNIQLNQDMFALSELVQWIFRSAIRNGKKINVYIPSQRMRELFLNWLNN